MTFPMPVVDGGVGAVTISYIGRNDTGSASTPTFAAQSIGTASPDRCVIVSVAQNSGVRPSTPTVTIGGISATSVVALRTDYSASASTTQALFIARVPTGTTADIVVTWGLTVDVTAIAVWAAYGIGSLTPFATSSSGADPAALSLNVPSGGVAVGALLNGVYGTSTWSGLTENFDADFRTFYNNTGASAAFSAGQTPATITCDMASPNVQAGVAASWRP